MSVQYKDLVENIVKLRGNGDKSRLNPAFSKFFKSKNWTFPEDRILLVAGTNGKGSVSFLVHRILMAHGFKVGLFTSPHLTDMRERIQINSSEISEESFLHIYQNLAGSTDLNELSFFEVLLLVALEYFEINADFIILEIGVGGREDPCSLVPHLWNLITSISNDHGDILGPDLKSIAEHKFGIIQNSGNCISGVQQLELRSQLKETSKSLGNSVQFVDVPSWSLKKEFPPQLTVRMSGKTIYSPMIGAHAAHNIAMAVEQSKAIMGRSFSWEICSEALLHSHWPGRMQFLSEDILLTGDHNEEGWKSLVENLKTLDTYQSFTFFVALGSNKSFEKFFDSIGHLPIEALFVYDKSFNAKPLSDYPNEVFNLPIKEINSLSALERHIDSNSKKGHLNVITGSLYFVGEVLRELSSRHE